MKQTGPKPPVYTEQGGEIRREDTGKQDFNANYFEWAKRAAKIQSLLDDNKVAHAQELILQEKGDSLRQEVASILGGKDPLHDTGGTEVMSPITREMRNQRLYGEKIGRLETAVKELKPDIDYLNNFWKSSVDSFKAVNAKSLAELHAQTPEQSAQMFRPVKILESEAGNIQQKIVKLNNKFRQIDPSFNVFSHPATAAAANGLGVMTNSERPTIFQKQQDPMKGIMTGTEFEVNASTVAWKGLKGAGDVIAPFLRPIGAAAGLIGDWILRNRFGEDQYNDIQQKIIDRTGWVPDTFGAPNIELKDQYGNSTVVRNRFGLPELMSPLGAFIFGKKALEFSESVQDGEQIWDAYHQGGRFWGAAGDIATWAGNMVGFGPVTAPFLGAAMKLKYFASKGLAMTALNATPRVAKIANWLGNGAAEISSMAMYEGISHGYVDGYTNSYVRGAEMGLAMWAIGRMGKGVETFLNRRKMPDFMGVEMPAFLSQMGGAAVEGVGFATYGALGQTLWEFLQSPNAYTAKNFKHDIGVDVLGMLTFKAFFGKNARMESLRESRMQGEQAKQEAEQKTVDEAGKRKAGEQIGSMLVDLREGRTDAPLEAFKLARYHRELGPIAKEIGEQGREEAAIGSSRGEPPQIGPAGSLSGKTGTYTVDATENVAERIMRMNRRQDAGKATADGGFASGELAVIGTHIGGKMVFSALKGARETATGPAEVSMGSGFSKLASQLASQGHSPEEIAAATDRAFTVHNHPSSTSLSGADLAFYGARAAKGARNHFVMTDRGVFAIRAPEGGKAVDANRMMLEIHQARGAPMAKAIKAIADGRIGDVPGARKSDLDLLQGKAVSSQELTKAFDTTWKNLKGSSPRERALGRIGAAIYSDAVQTAGAKHGFDIRYFEGNEGIQRFGEFQKSGDYDAAFGAEAPAPAPSGAGAAFEKQTGITPTDTVSEPSPEKQEALAHAYKVGDLEAFFQVAEEQISGDVAHMEHTPANAERLMRYAGIQTGAEAPVGAAERTSFGRRAADDAEVSRMVRAQIARDAKAREMDKEADFSESLKRPTEAALYRDIGEKVRTGEQEIGPPAHEPDILSESAKEPPSDEDAAVFLANMLGERSKLFEKGPSAYQRVKGLADRFARGFESFFKSPSTREQIAQKIEKAGYRSKFTKLGEDETFVLSETDRLNKDFRLAPRLSAGDLEDIFKPITDKEGVTPEQRVEELMAVQRYAVLKDQFENRIRTSEIKERDAQGKVVLDDEGNPKTVKIEKESPLPGGLTPDQWQRALLQAESALTAEGRESYVTMRKTLDAVWDSMVDRGVARKEDKQAFYYPRKVSDYADFMEGIGPLRQTLPKEPFRGFLKARRGSERLVDATPEALMGYLTKVRLTNAVHDYNERVSRGIEDRLLDELGTDRESIKDMDGEEWRDLRSRAEQEHQAIVVDIERGRMGAQSLERDTVALDTLALIRAETDMRGLPEAIVGGDIRPDAASGRFLVTKPLVEFFRSQRLESSWLTHPLLRGLRRQIGKWFKGPAMRGLFGLRVPGRNVRNIASDLSGVAFKDSAKAAAETAALIGKASPISAALASSDPDQALAKLSPAAQSIARELQRYNTVKTGPWTSEVEGMRDQLEGQWLKRYMPETRNFLGWASKMARADYKWARAVDDYGENLVRIAYFMRERTSALRDLQTDADGVRPEETPEIEATRRAHLQVSDVLINYDWLTPLERTALNGLAFPFYTWARHNFTKTLAELVRHPANSLGKYAALSGIIATWNWTMAGDEESRLTQLRPELAGKGHFFMPWIRDEFGNPLILTFEDTFTAAGDFLGLSGIGNKIGAYMAHGNEQLLMRDIFSGGADNAQRAFANATAPWIRSVLDVGYRSKFQTVGERAENMVPSITKGFLPGADAARYLGQSERDESVGSRALLALPMLRFIDLTQGVPLSQASGQFEAGRIQREKAQGTSGMAKEMTRFIAGFKSGDTSQMNAAVQKVWAEIGPGMSESGMSEAHLWARMIHAASRDMRQRAMSEGGGSLPPKFLELSRTQKAEYLMRTSR